MISLPTERYESNDISIIPREIKKWTTSNKISLGDVGVASLQATGDGRSSNVLGKEEVTGKLHQVRRDVGTILSQTAHGEPTWNMRPPDKEGRWDRGGTKHLCGVLNQVTQVGKVPGTGLPHGSTQYGKAAGTFHVPTFLVSDSGGPGGKGTAAPLRLVWDAHASGESHQEPLDGKMRP